MPCISEVTDPLEAAMGLRVLPCKKKLGPLWSLDGWLAAGRLASRLAKPNWSLSLLLSCTHFTKGSKSSQNKNVEPIYNLT